MFAILLSVHRYYEINARASFFTVFTLPKSIYLLRWGKPDLAQYMLFKILVLEYL